jgi:hypothetical protein
MVACTSFGSRLTTEGKTWNAHHCGPCSVIQHCAAEPLDKGSNAKRAGHWEEQLADGVLCDEAV